MEKCTRIPRMEDMKTAAALFGLSYYATRQLVLSGKVPAIRLGAEGSRGKILVNCDALSTFLSTSKINSEDKPAVINGIRVQH